jgi:hypothetical protein
MYAPYPSGGGGYQTTFSAGFSFTGGWCTETVDRAKVIPVANSKEQEQVWQL